MLTEFHVSGYKSLYDCTITDLQPINVFHGGNNVGKSNILEALETFYHALEDPRSIPPPALFSWGEAEMVLQGRFVLAGETQTEATAQFAEARGRWIVTVDRKTATYTYADDGKSPLLDEATQAICSAFRLYRVPARRRLEVEQATRTEQPLNPEGANLKERLFWASVSQDPEERKAFYNVLRPLFAEPPLALGTLQPVASPGGPYDVQMETATRSIPLEQMGSGIQQLVLLAGLIALSRAAVIAIEEPEINLSWSTQKKLRLIFQRMVERPDTPPHQIFISSHSPLFEFYENFYRVDMVDGHTQVTRVANVERHRIFDSITLPSDKRAAWLHEENVVMLPPYVVETLGVRQGDLVYFLPQENRVLMLNEQDFADLARPEDDET